MSLLVVGALHWDVVVDAPRLPRLGETLRGHGVSYRLGGKAGNQAIAAARAGAKVAIACRIGDDAAGETMAAELSDVGVDTSLLQRGDGRSGMSAAITVSNGDYGAVIVSGENHAFDMARLAIPDTCRIVLAQNEMAPGLLAPLSKAARNARAEFWVNFAPASPLDADPGTVMADVLIVNRLEAGDLLGTSADHLNPCDIVDALQSAAPNTVCIVTLGGDGVAVKPLDGEAIHIPAKPVVAVSTHGAGDVFCGTLAAARLSGSDWHSAIDAAQIAAAEHVAQIR